jgi:SAM-dependent methyltransferase
MADPRSLLRVLEDDAEYRRQAEAEAEFWRRTHPAGLEAVEITQSEGPVDRYVNRRFTGDERVHWYETIARHGPFRRGAILGTSSLVLERRILETNPSLQVTFFDIADGALARREELFRERFPGRVSTQVADLNFVELPPDTYDLIVSSSTIHHVTNVEHLAYQIDRALTPDGYFFLEDYVGEKRFQFDDEKKRVYLEVFNRDRARQGAPRCELIWLDASDLSPFCGLRSDEVLAVFRRHLDEVALHTASALVTPLLRSRPAQDFAHSPWVSGSWILHGPAWWRFFVRYVGKRLWGRTPSMQTLLDPEFLGELFLLSDVLTESRIVKPGQAFVTYRKKAGRQAA